jgi:hypothetical protein
MWIGVNDKGCCPDHIYRAMWIGKYVKGSFHDQFNELFGLEQTIDDDVMN